MTYNSQTTEGPFSILEQLKTATPERAATEEVKPPPSAVTCLHCDRKPIARGLCSKHYADCRKLVTEGKTSWDDLEKVGGASHPTLARPAASKKKRRRSTAKTGTKTICMFPSCKKDSATRGLCHAHYQVARSLVKRKRTNWHLLEKHRKCAPVKSMNADPSKWFLKA